MTKAMIAMVFLLGACGDKDCEELCREGQEGGCTTIQGNCGSFCGALDSVEGPGGCADERDSYESCLNEQDDVCDASCGLYENALSSCVQAYCVGHASDSACVTLAGSF